MNFRVAVADDEPLARTMVASLVRKDPEVEDVCECADGKRLLQVVARNRSDIVFVDVEMPGADGLEVASALKPSHIAVVIVTAFGQYAAAAFDAAAVDYIVKPFSDDRFRESLERAKRRVRDHRIGELANQTAALVGASVSDLRMTTTDRHLQYIAVKERERVIRVGVSNIVWIEAEDYCVLIHTTDRKTYLLRASLTSLEEQLDSRDFVRVHRTAIVNAVHVRSMETADRLWLCLSDGSTVSVSRAKRARVQSILAPTLRHRSTRS